ncbi:MAG: flavodoxin domain-containing protein [Candidatus Bathyarchaeota archaeon]|nr:flavodoxin domain-containing protein [Candidatus Bathyarchaeota archaeon]
MKAIVIYDTQFGNTEQIAKVLASSMNEQGISVDCFKVDNLPIETLPEYDLLAIGGPTHGFGMSGPMKTFMKKLEHVDLKDKKVFAFDTKNRSRFWGSAAKGIEKRMKKFGMNIVIPCASGIVKGLKGPLQEGTEAKFRQIGIELSSK